MVFTYEKKMIRPIRIANDVFSLVRKMIRPMRSHTKKSEKHPGNLSGIVLFVSLSMKKTVESWENKRKGKN